MKNTRNALMGLLGVSMLAVVLTGCDDDDRTAQTTQTLTASAQGSSPPVTTTVTTNYLVTATGQMFTTSAAAQFFSTPGTLQTGLPPLSYLQKLFHTPYDPMLQFYLPRYSYFQGLCYSAGNLKLIGQVRVIGAAMSAGSGKEIVFAQGGMVTTDPDYLKDRIQPAHRRYTIVQWKQVP